MSKDFRKKKEFMIDRRRQVKNKSTASMSGIGVMKFFRKFRTQEALKPYRYPREYKNRSISSLFLKSTMHSS